MTSALDQMGGEPELRALVKAFYDLVESDPAVHELHRLHFRGHGMEHIRSEQFNFLSGFMGGRPYYMEKHGHMNVREIHAHVPIRVADAEMWLETFDRALEERELGGPHIDKIRATLRRVALMLVNEVPDWRTGETA